MLINTKSLCGFVSNQVQYNLECAQYQGYSYYIMIIDKYILGIYIYNSRNLDCDPYVSWSFLQSNNHKAVKKMK